MKSWIALWCFLTMLACVTSCSRLTEIKDIVQAHHDKSTSTGR